MLDITATKLLIGGGLVAGVTAAWGHIRNFASRASTYLVIKATFNPKLSLAVMAYLKANYRQVPTGTYVFDSRLERIKVQGTTAWLPVPYRVLDRSVIFWKGKTVLFVTVDNILTIRTLRGMVDFQDLLNEALDWMSNVLWPKTATQRSTIRSTSARWLGLLKTNSALTYRLSPSSAQSVARLWPRPPKVLGITTLVVHNPGCSLRHEFPVWPGALCREPGRPLCCPVLSGAHHARSPHGSRVA